MADRQNLMLVKSNRRDPAAHDYGEYALLTILRRGKGKRHYHGFTVAGLGVAGTHLRTLDDVETWLKNPSRTAKRIAEHEAEQDLFAIKSIERARNGSNEKLAAFVNKLVSEGMPPRWIAQAILRLATIYGEDPGERSSPGEGGASSPDGSTFQARTFG